MREFFYRGMEPVQLNAEVVNRVIELPALCAISQMLEQISTFGCFDFMIDEAVDGYLMICAGHVVLHPGSRRCLVDD